MNDILKSLEEIGLSPAEAQVYLIVLKKGTTKAGQVISESNISSSNVHEALEKLTKKGLISFILKNNIKEYQAIKPEMLKLLIEKDKEKLRYKEEKLSLILKEMEFLQKESPISENAEVFIGFNGLKSGFQKLLSKIEKNRDFVFFYKAKKEDIEIVQEFFSKMDIEDYYNKIPSRAIFSENYKGLFNQRKKNKIKAKFTDKPIPSSINIFNDKMLIISWKKKPVAFLIQSKDIAETFYQLFEETWDSVN